MPELFCTTNHEDVLRKSTTSYHLRLGRQSQQSKKFMARKPSCYQPSRLYQNFSIFSRPSQIILPKPALLHYFENQIPRLVDSNQPVLFLAGHYVFVMLRLILRTRRLCIGTYTIMILTDKLPLLSLSASRPTSTRLRLILLALPSLSRVTSTCWRLVNFVVLFANLILAVLGDTRQWSLDNMRRFSNLFLIISSILLGILTRDSIQRPVYVHAWIGHISRLHRGFSPSCKCRLL